MKVKFVTCLYDGLFGTKFCGRANRGIVFKRSLKTISQIQTPIICYTSSRELPELQQLFSDCQNIELRVKELDSFYFHSDADKVRDANPDYYRTSADWQFRCVEIMWGKFLFLKEVIAEDPELEQVYWIDAGLSHAGIIHSRFNPHYTHNINFIWDLDPKTLDLSAKNDLIFNEEFTPSLVNYVGRGNILNILCSNVQHRAINDNDPFVGSVIGGLFGGDADLVDNYCDAVIREFERYLGEGKLFKEEQLMTKIMREDNFPIKKYFFDTWYHGDWNRGYYKTINQVSFCDFFDEINPRR